tara:strand:- start:423 stop:1097 length:675 start_codon:yes stop_codon:yes gene_type:complete
MKLISRINHSLSYTKIGSVYRKIGIRNNLNLYKNKGILFIHVPKNAGTSINYSLYGKSIGHFTALEFRKVAKKEFNNLYKFAIIRNPYDRLISAYSFMQEGLYKEMINRPSILKTKKILQLKGIDINKFVLEWLPENGNYIDFIFMPQNHFICDKKKDILIDKLIKFDELSKLKEIIYKETGVKLNKLNVKNRTEDKQIYILSNESKSYIRQLYKKDFELFEAT